VTSNRILELINRLPFVPLEIHLSDGARISVTYPYDIAVNPHSADFTVFEDHQLRFVSVRSITEVVTSTDSADA
jgi:hypothetical protein